MKLRAPVREQVSHVSELFAGMLAQQRAVLITPEHEAYLKEKERMAEVAREEAEAEREIQEAAAAAQEKETVSS